MWWVGPEEGKGLHFRSFAKAIAARLPALHKTVFLDCGVLPIKNCDELFRLTGTQFVESGHFAAIMVKSRSIGKDEQDLITNLVIAKENREHFYSP